MFINKVSIPFNDNNFKILGDIAQREIITNFDFRCENDKIIINLYDNMAYCRLNNELKSLNIFYEVLGLKGNKEDIIDIYHHLINWIVEASF